MSFDEYVLKYDSFPDLIFMGSRFFNNFFIEDSNLRKLHDVRNWKVLNDPIKKNYEVLGCKVILVNDEFYNCGFFEFDDLERAKDYIFDSDFRKSEDRFAILKNIENSCYSSCEPTQLRSINHILNIPFSVIDAFKLENITKKEIEERKRNFQIIKGIYEPEQRF